MSSDILNKLVNAIDKKAATAKRPQRLTVQKQAQLLYNSVLVYLANENPKVLPERRVTKRAAMTVVRRSLDRTRGLSFSIREYQALRDLGTFISMSQNPGNRTATFAENTDLLPLSHPLCSRAHSMTASALRQARGRWLSTDPRLEDDLRAVVASAFGAPVGTPAQVYAVAQLQSVIGRFVPNNVLSVEAQTIVAALKDGNSSAARRARAMLQRRDSEGQFAEMGGGRRWLLKAADGLVSWVTGRTVAADVDTDTFDIQTPDGKIYRVPAQATSGVKAVLKPGVDVDKKGEARYSSKDKVLTEADIKLVEAPAGFRVYKDTLQGRTTYMSTDDEYAVTKVDKPDQALKDTIAGIRKHNESQESLEPDKREIRELIGDGENGAWDKQKPYYIATRMDQDSNGKPKLVSIGVAQNWADTQKIIKTDEPRLDKSVEEREVKARLKSDTWDAWQVKVDKFNEQAKALHAEHVAERMAMLKKQAADRVDNQGSPLEPGWSAVTPDEKNVRPPSEVVSIPGMYKDSGMGKELNPLDPDQGELFDADPTPKKYDVNDTEFVKNNALELSDGGDIVVARLEQNEDGSFRAPYVFGQSRGLEFKTFKDRPEFIEALKQSAAEKRAKLAEALEEIGAEQKTIDAVKAENARRADIVEALAKDAKVDDIRKRAADAAWADKQSPGEKSVVKLSERLQNGNLWSSTEIDEMVAGKPPRLDGPEDVEKPAAPQQQKKTVPTESKPFSYSVPSNAYRMNLETFSPEGPAEGQESSDYTDDPVEIGNRYPEAELRESLAKALINKQSEFDAYADEDFDSDIDDFDPDEMMDEDAPKKPGPKPKSKKKQAADSGVKTMDKDTAPASGFGMLEFNAGSEYVPAEALYKALEEQGVDAELYVAQLYDAKLGENKNVKALLDSRKGEETVGQESPDLADVFPAQADLDEMDSVKIPSEGSDKLQIDETNEEQAKTFELSTAMNAYKKQYNEKIAAGDVDEATEAVYNDFIGADPGDKDYITQLEKHFDQDKFGSADDPFRAVWGSWMMEGPDNGQKKVNPALRQYAQDTLGMDEDEADAFTEGVIDAYGNPGELEEAIAAIEAEPELFNSSDAQYATAQALLKMSAVNSGTNATKVWKSYDLSDDQGFADALSEEGNVVSFPPDSWKKATGDIDDVLEGKSGDGTFVVVIDEGNGTSTPIGEERELVWGQYAVESVVDKDGRRIVRLRKLTPAENISINEEGNYLPYLIPNESIDLPEGYNLPDTDAYASEYNGADGNEVAAGFPEGFTDSPLYIADNWDTETLIDSLKIAVEPDLEEESAGYAILEYPLDGGTDILVSGQAIRDALQIQGVNTNLLFRDLAGTGDEVAPPSEEDVARQNKPALSKSKNPTGAIGTSVGSSFDITGWKKVGNQLGSNEGGTYEAPDGSKYYVKTPKSPLHAGNEVLASALYRRADVDGADTFFGVDEAGNMVTVSPILPDAKPDMAKKIDEPSYKKALQSGFAVDAWLANWDVAGLAMDNVVSVDNKPNRVDTGGALLMRAMGKPKGELFGDKADEWETLRDPDMNPQSAKIFADMTEPELKASASKLVDITKADIDSLVAAAFPDEPVLQKIVADKLEMRRIDILERAGLIDKVDAPTPEIKPVGKPEPVTELPEKIKPVGEIPEPEIIEVKEPPAAVPSPGPVGKSLSADGKTPIAAGMKVKSTKSGEVGVVSKLDVYKKKGVVFPDYAWVKFDGKKDKQLKATKTLQIVDDGGFPEGGPGGGEPDTPAPTEPAPSSEPAVPLSPEPTPSTADDPIALQTSGTLQGLHDQIDKAIKDKKLLKFVYNGKPRVVRPLNTWDNPKTGTKNLVAQDLGDNEKKKNFSTHLIEPDVGDPVKPKPADLPVEQKYTAPPEPQFGAVSTYKLANINDTTTVVGGTYFLNEVLLYTPNDLAKLLGKPFEYDEGGKTQQEWTMRFESPDGPPVFATLYDWKEERSLDPDKKYFWHVGGNSTEAVVLVKNLLDAKKKEKEKSATAETPVESPALISDKKDLDNPDLYEKKDVKVEDLKVGDYIPYGSGWARVSSHSPAYNKGKKTHKFRMFLRHTNGTQQYVEYSGKTVIKSTRSPKGDTKIDAQKPTVPNPPPPPSSQSLPSKVESNEVDYGPFTTTSALKNSALATKFWIGDFTATNKEDKNKIDYVSYSPYSGTFIVGIKDQPKPKMILSDGTVTDALETNEIYKENPHLQPVQKDSPHAYWLGITFDKDLLEAVKDDVAPPPGANQKFKKDKYGNWLYKGVTVTDADGQEGVVYGFPGAKGYENYVQVQFLDGSKKVRSIYKINGGRLFDQEKQTESGPGVNVPEIDDPEITSIDWSQSELTGAGVKPLEQAIAHVLSSPASGARGRSAAIDAGDVEDLDVHLMTVVDGDKTFTRASFKLTSWAGDAAIAELLKKVKNTADYDLFINQGIRMPKMRRDSLGRIAVVKSGTQTEWEYTSSYYNTTTYVLTDKVTGAVIRIYRANRDAKPVKTLNTEISGLAFHNRVEIFVEEPAFRPATPQDANSTANIIGRAMKLAGVRAPRPARKEDVRVLAENRLLSIFGKETDPAINVVGNTRKAKLGAIEKLLGVPFDQMWANLDTPAYDLNDRLSYRTSRAVAEYIIKKTSTGAITHNFGIKGDGTPDESAQALFNLLMQEDGLKATSVRWTEGIGGQGDSSHKDITTGGADYLFTKPKAVMKLYEVGNDKTAYFHFDPQRLYSRLDFWANISDKFGKRFASTDPVGQIKPKAGGTYELMFKNGISWADLAMISVTPQVREILVKMLLDSGVPPEKFGAQSYDDLIPVKK